MAKIMENPIKIMDDLEVPLFLETPKWVYQSPSWDVLKRYLVNGLVHPYIK